MKIGVFQFSGSGNLLNNHEAILRGITGAAQNKVRLLVFQECATCGYPPVEAPAIDQIDFSRLEEGLQEIRQLAKQYAMYIALGTIRQQDGRNYNTLQLIDPDGNLMGHYDKRALWGWDVDSFAKGKESGIFQIDDIQVGFRICFEVRFPEYFRELFQSNVQLCFVSFCDVSDHDLTERYSIIKAHLVTRAVENIMTVISVNSTSKYQTGPTVVIDSEGLTVDEAPRNQEYLLTYDYNAPITMGYGAKGRLQLSEELLENKR